jgi:DHA1 family bicyclomycin/chloramphenicol resistance-like MFS transporter
MAVDRVRLVPMASSTTGPLRTHLGLLAIVGSLSAFAPLSIDMYLPGLPQLATDLSATASEAQLTLTTFLVGLAVGQLIAGPLSDRMGRRPPLIGGVLLYTVASLGCAIAGDIWAFATLRILQGLGGAAGVVIGRAIVRDHFGGSTLARAFAFAMLVNGLAPILAPIIGAQLLPVGGWRGLFVVLAGIGGTLLVVIVTRLAESLPLERRRGGGVGTVARTYAGLLGDRLFMGQVLTVALGFAAMFGYISASPFIVQELYGQSPQTFSLLFGINALGIMAATQASGLLVGRYGPRRILRVALVSAAIGGVVLVVAATSGTGLWSVAVGFFIVVASYGAIAPNAVALAMADQPHQAGSASALMGALQFLIGSLAAPLVGLGDGSSAVPAALVIAGCAWAALVVSLTLGRGRHGEAPITDLVSPAAGPGPAR